MFSWIKDYFHRHKKKIFITGALVGGSYLVGKVVQWKLNEWRGKESDELINRSRKQYHFESNQRTCCMTFMSFLPTLRENLVKQLNVEQLTEKLKSSPSDKLEIWETLKIEICTRTIASVISVCILHVFLKVQMNVIGGYMYLDHVAESNEQLLAESIGDDSFMSNYKPGRASHEIQKEYLNNVRFLLEKGILLLTDDVKELVKGVIGEVTLKQKLSHYEFSRLVFEIWGKLKSRKVTSEESTYFEEEQEDDESMQLPIRKNAEGNSLSVFCSYMLDHNIFEENFDCGEVNNVSRYKLIMEETTDILENEDCLAVVSECVKKGLEELLVNLEPFFLSPEEDPEAILPVDQDETAHIKLRLPLAKILPLVNSQINQIFKSGRNNYLDVIFGVQSVNDFAGNIYESFSSDLHIE